MKTHYILPLIVILLIASCKKEDNDHPISFQIKTSIPYDSTPIAGLKYIIQEYKAHKTMIGVELKPTDWKMEGSLDATGIKDIMFLPKKNKHYSYQIRLFIYSNINSRFLDR